MHSKASGKSRHCFNIDLFLSVLLLYLRQRPSSDRIGRLADQNKKSSRAVPKLRRSTQVRRTAMDITRRSLIRGGFASAAVLTSPLRALGAPALIGLRQLDTRSLSFDCVNTAEQLKAVDYWIEGEYVPDALAAINRALRDFMSGQVYPIEPKLLDAMHQIGRRLETSCRFELLCGYRSPETNAKLSRMYSGVASHSLHMKGQATDIALPGRPLREVHETALALRAGGVGFYPDQNFVHIDIGRVRRWVG